MIQNNILDCHLVNKRKYVRGVTENSKGAITYCKRKITLLYI